MKKRLRKKKFLGEFTIWYWHLIVKFIPELSKVRLSEITQELFTLLDTNKLSWSGGSDVHHALFYIDADKRYDSVTEEQRQLITIWLIGLSEVERVVDRPLSKGTK